MNSIILSPSKRQNAPALTPLSPSKRGLENRKAVSKDSLQEKMIRVSCNIQMTFEERIRYLTKHANRFKCMEDHPESKKISKQCLEIISTLEKEQQVLSHRFMECTQLSFELFSQNLQPCIDYTLLDSVPQLHLSHLGVPAPAAIQYFISLLREFYFLNPIEEIKQVMDALDEMFHLFVLQCEKSSRAPDKITRPLHWYQTRICALTKKLQKGEIPYLFLPMSSSDHAIVGKVEWKGENGFYFTIINTGDGAKYVQDHRASDLVYPHLNDDEMNDIASALYFMPKRAADCYRNLGMMLSPHQRLQAMQGRSHKLQRGNSCSSQSLSSLIHGVLPSQIYWKFKAFATECALKELPPGSRHKAASNLLLKRRKKID